MVFENRVLRRIFGPKRDEVTGEWRKLHNEELNDLYCSPNIVRVINSRMRWARQVACVWRDWVSVGKLEGKRPFGRPRRRENNINPFNPELNPVLFAGIIRSSPFSPR